MKMKDTGLDTRPGWEGYEDLTPEAQAELRARIQANQNRGETLGGGRRARRSYGLPGITIPIRTEPVPGSKAAARAGRKKRGRILD